MKTHIISKFAIVYLLGALIYVFYFASERQYDALLTNSPAAVSNRESTLGLFFPRWDEINKKYNFIGVGHDDTPRWYKIATDPSFKLWPEEIQKVRAKEYVRQYIGNAAGIDSRKVERWLLEMIYFVNAKTFTYEDIFGSEESPTNTLIRSTYEAHLTQAVNFLPLASHWYALQNHISLTLAVYPVLVGLPLFLLQIVIWVFDLVRKRKPLFLFLTKRSLLIVTWLALVIGTIYFVVGARREYQTEVITKFVMGRWYFIGTGVIEGIVGFFLAFLGF